MSATMEPAGRPTVLFLTPRPPDPAGSSPQRRAFHALRCLSRRCAVHVATLVEGADSQAPPEALSGLGAQLHALPVPTGARDAADLARSMVGGGTTRASRAGVEAVYDWLWDLTRAHSFDALHADQQPMAGFASGLDVPYRVLDLQLPAHRLFEASADAEASLVRRWILGREAARLARHEAHHVGGFDRVLFLCEPDRASLRRRCSPTQAGDLDARSAVVPLGVDLANDPLTSVRADARRITMSGSMRFAANAEAAAWMALRVLPRVLDAVPDAVLTVIGEGATESLRGVLERAGPNVEAVDCPVAPKSLLEETAVVAVPARSAGGMRARVLDSWSWGLPVVSTTAGAECAVAEPGRDILVADEPDAFAEAVVTLLESAPRRSELGAAGRRSAELHHAAELECERLAEAYAPVLGGAGSAELPSG